MKVPQNAIEIPAKSFLRLRLFYEAVPRKRNKKGMNLYPAPKYTDSTKRTSPVRNMKFLMKAFCEHDHAIFPLEPDSLVDLAKERMDTPALPSNDCRVIMKPHEPICPVNACFVPCRLVILFRPTS